MTHSELTTEAAQELCLEWQQRLRLSEWDIQVKVLPLAELTRSDCLGSINWHAPEKRANIELMCVADAVKITSKHLERTYDIEETLVHELLHLHLALWQVVSEVEENAQEFAINAIAGALCKLLQQQGECDRSGSSAVATASKRAKKGLARQASASR